MGAMMRGLMQHLRTLTRLDRRRLEVTLVRISRSPVLIAGLNTYLLAVNAAARLRARLKPRSGLEAALANPGARADFVRPALPRMVPGIPRVLLVVEDTVPQCYHYRVRQKLEMFGHLGWPARAVGWRDLRTAREQVHFHDVVIFYRVPGFPDVLDLIGYTRALNKVVIYDVDDLIFDAPALKEKFRRASGQLPERERVEMIRGADLFLAALRACGRAMASTPALAGEIRRLTGFEECAVLPNGLGDLPERGGRLTGAPRGGSGEVRLFYGSGTKTHDEDFALAAPALARVLAGHERVRLLLVGSVTLPAALAAHRARILQLPPLSFDAFLSVLAQADINLAPLEPGVFADCKSEIKWLEAAGLGIPSVVSPTGTYRQAISDGVDGQLAAGEPAWEEALNRLIESPELRRKMGEAARRTAGARYPTGVLAGVLRQIIENAIGREVRDGRARRDDRRGHVLLVNTLYPPGAFGGATVVTKNIADALCGRYADRFRVSVFAADIAGRVSGQLHEQALDGAWVTKATITPALDGDAAEADEDIKRLFARYLEYARPDLIHFHSVQRLTASVVAAAQEAGIPYIVTAHDAWWLSEHQFLTDANGRVLDERQGDPLIAAQSATDPDRALRRFLYLRERLAGAAAVLAVSGYQAGLYQRNGFANVHVNKNGVDKPVLPPRVRAEGDVLRLGYAGGVSPHKGYDLLKQCLSTGEYPHLELTVIDFWQAPGRIRDERWGESRVRFVPPYAAGEMGRFYASLDVLIAPSAWPEAFGLVAREAALAGLWVVVSDAGGLPEDIAGGDNAIVFKAGDATALISVLRSLENERRRFREPPDAAAARRRIPGVEAQLAQLVALYDRVLAPRLDAEEGEVPSPTLFAYH